MHKILQAASLAALMMMFGGHVAIAGTLADDFSTNPFGGTGIWCERWHDATYDSILDLLLLRGSSTCSGAPCCTACSPSYCSSAPGTVALVISKASQEALTSGRDRTASTKWALTTDLTSGEHTAIWPVVHPYCHAGVQGTVFRDIPASAYRLIL
jgi:hypothetical protein